MNYHVEGRRVFPIGCVHTDRVRTATCTTQRSKTFFLQFVGDREERAEGCSISIWISSVLVLSSLQCLIWVWIYMDFDPRVITFTSRARKFGFFNPCSKWRISACIVLFICSAVTFVTRIYLFFSLRFGNNKIACSFIVAEMKVSLYSQVLKT